MERSEKGESVPTSHLLVLPRATILASKAETAGKKHRYASNSDSSASVLPSQTIGRLSPTGTAYTTAIKHEQRASLPPIV